MLRLTIYKNKACIYLVGGTEEPVIAFRKNELAFLIAIRLWFTLSEYFWDRYEGMYYKDKLYSIKTPYETALKIKELIKEK